MNFVGFLWIAAIVGFFLFVIISRKKYRQTGLHQKDLENEDYYYSAFDINDVVESTYREEVAKRLQEDNEKCIWFNKLKIWYFKNAKAYEENISRYFYGIILSIFAKVAASILIITFQSENEVDSIAVIVIPVLNALFVVGCYLWYRFTKKSLKNRRSEVEQNDHIDIWQMCFNVQKEMNLNSLTVRIWLITRSSDNLIYSVKKKDTINLYFSSGMVNAFGNKPKELESMIGHEFSHAFQGDDDINISIQKSALIPSTLITIIILLSAVYMIFRTISYNFEYYFIDIWLTLFFLYNFWSLFFARVESEHLADVASYIFVKDSKIKFIIETYMPKFSSVNYPSRKARIAYIDKIVKENS